MADRPILFSAPMIAALLAGRKTMTRRVITRKAALDCLAAFGPEMFMKPGNADLVRYTKGDRLWVREMFCYAQAASHPYVHFRQYDPKTPTVAVMHRAGCWDEWPKTAGIGRWSPSIHMPRWASRITLLVDEVKVERLQEISEEDAIAEGATMRPNCRGFRDLGNGWSMDWSRVGEPSPFGSCDNARLHERDVSLGCARTAFGAFINELHGGRHWNLPGKPTPIWDVNPWCAAIRFRVVTANIDSLPAGAA